MVMEMLGGDAAAKSYEKRYNLAGVKKRRFKCITLICNQLWYIVIILLPARLSENYRR